MWQRNGNKIKLLLTQQRWDLRQTTSMFDCLHLTFPSLSDCETFEGTILIFSDSFVDNLFPLIVESCVKCLFVESLFL